MKGSKDITSPVRNSTISHRDRDGTQVEVELSSNSHMNNEIQDSETELISTQKVQEVRVITRDRPRREIRPPKRLIDEANLVGFAFAVASETNNYYEPTNFKEVIESPNSDKWIIAMEKEMEALQQNNTWRLSKLPPGKRAIKSKWVFKSKDEIPGVEDARYKARLVGKGFSQIPSVDFTDIYSQVVKHTSIRLLLDIVALRDLQLEQLDVKTTFLHGELDKEIYMEQPEGYYVEGKEDYVCKLQKSLYGLKQSPRLWYKRFDQFITGIGFKRSSFDACVYIKNNYGLYTYLLLYMDDMLIAAKSM